MQFLREAFDGEGVKSCAAVEASNDGAKVRGAGVVLVRQMPGDAGVVFITLSDETGITNVVVWPRLVQEFRREIMGGGGCCWWKARCRAATTSSTSSPNGSSTVARNSSN